MKEIKIQGVRIPEGGDLGEEIISKGTPIQLSDNPKSKTGRYLV